MEDQLISFETAKLAKEKRFDVLCDNGFYKDGDKIIETHLSDYSNIVNFNNNTEYDYSAPTQSLLQKWLREVHNIYVNSYHDFNPKGDFIIYYTNWGFINDPSSKNYKYCPQGGYDEFSNWKTYEEALEVGLQEALKLIK